MLEIDSKTLEDLEFDRLLGKVPSSSANSPMQEEDLLEFQNIPHITKLEESKLLEQYQYSKLESKALQEYVQNDGFKSHLMKLVVIEERSKHKRLQPPPP